MVSIEAASDLEPVTVMVSPYLAAFIAASILPWIPATVSLWVIATEALTACASGTATVMSPIITAHATKAVADKRVSAFMLVFPLIVPLILRIFLPTNGTCIQIVNHVSSKHHLLAPAISSPDPPVSPVF